MYNIRSYEIDLTIYSLSIMVYILNLFQIILTIFIANKMKRLVLLCDIIKLYKRYYQSHILYFISIATNKTVTNLYKS